MSTANNNTNLLLRVAELFDEPEVTCNYCKTPTHSLDADSLCDDCSEHWNRLIEETAEYALPRAAECSSCGEYNAPAQGTFCRCCATAWADAIFEPSWDDPYTETDTHPSSPPPRSSRSSRSSRSPRSPLPSSTPVEPTSPPPAPKKSRRTGPAPRDKKFSKKLYEEEDAPCYGCGQLTDADNGFCSRSCLNWTLKEE